MRTEHGNADNYAAGNCYLQVRPWAIVLALRSYLPSASSSAIADRLEKLGCCSSRHIDCDNIADEVPVGKAPPTYDIVPRPRRLQSLSVSAG